MTIASARSWYEKGMGNSRVLIRVRRNWALLTLLGLYLCLSLAYGLANPPFEGNDELAHYLYIRHLVTQRRLPVQETPALKDYQNHHPPLYYLLGAMASFWVDDGDLPAIVERGNPFWGYDPWSVGQDNKNQFLYTPFERFPGSGSVRRLRLVRLVSTLIGLGTVLATYGAAKEVFPHRRDMALGALDPGMTTDSSLTSTPLLRGTHTAPMSAASSLVRRVLSEPSASITWMSHWSPTDLSWNTICSPSADQYGYLPPC